MSEERQALFYDTYWRPSIYRARSVGDRLADLVPTIMGTWFTIFAHVVWFGIWLWHGPEQRPYGLLTLIVSLEAIFLTTFVLMSQRRQDAKDRERDDGEAHEVHLLWQQEVGQADAVLATLDRMQRTLVTLEQDCARLSRALEQSPGRTES